MSRLQYRHIKSGKLYKLITVARMENNPQQQVVVYCGQDHRTWVRPLQKFRDKFERIDQPGACLPQTSGE